MKMTETDQILADRLLRVYLNQLIKVGYIDKFGKDFFFHLAEINRTDAHTFIVEALVEFVLNLQQEPEEENLPTEGDIIH